MDPQFKDILYQNKGIIRRTKSNSLLKELIQKGHGGFLYQWRQSPLDNIKKEKQLKELVKCDRQIRKVFQEDIGGLAGYLDMGQKLIYNFHGNAPHPTPVQTLFLPQTTDLRKGKPPLKIVEAEESGIRHLHKIALILVAGGLGERLGSTMAKVSLKIHHLNHSACLDDSFLGFYLKNIIALQKLYREKTGKSTEIPLFIMCSDHNRDSVMKELKVYYRLGLRPRQIFIALQLDAPCLDNLKGDIALDPKDPYRLIKKPLGHGFVHTLIHQEQFLDHPIMEKKEYLFFLQDTNPQSMNVLLSGLGITHKLGYVMSWIGVERRPGEQAGLIVGRKMHKDKEKKGKTKNCQVVNIEYNRLQAGMDLPPRQYFANTNNFWLRIREYRRVLKQNRGRMPFMVNPKPIASSIPSSSIGKQYSPFRPETLMQDIAQDLPPFIKENPNAGILLYPRHLAFSPVKRSLSDIKLGQWKNLAFPDLAYTSLELELNDNLTNLEKLQERNTVLIESGQTIPSVLTPLFYNPKIILDPLFKLSHKYLEKNIENCTFHPQSLLVVQGGDICLRNVVLTKHAALLIHLPPMKSTRLLVEDITVDKEGFIYHPITTKRKKGERSIEEMRRGYRISWKHPLIIKLDKPGNYRYSQQGLERG